MEWNIEASQDKPTEYGHQPDAFVRLIQPEIIGWDGGQAETGRVRVGVDVSSFPHFTLAEARQVIAALMTAAEKGEELQTAKHEARPPEPADVDALTGLLDMMLNFASDEQRARYLLSSNWLRDRGAELGRALFPRPVRAGRRPNRSGRSQPAVSHDTKIPVEACLPQREQRGKWAYHRAVTGAPEPSSRPALLLNSVT